MANASLNRLLDEVKRLTFDEWRELRNLMDESATQPSLSTKEDQLTQILLERGIIRRVLQKPTEANIARYNAWKPVPIVGKTLSQTILEERR